MFAIENIELDEVKHIISDLSAKKEALQAQDASESSGNAARIVLQSFDDVFTVGDQNTRIAALRAIIEYVSVTQGQAEIHFNF